MVAVINSKGNSKSDTATQRMRFVRRLTIGLRASMMKPKRYSYYRRTTMKPMQFLLVAAIALVSPTISHAQVAGATPLGVTVTELAAVVKGWSVKRTVLGQPVYNDKDEKVGSVDDII